LWGDGRLIGTSPSFRAAGRRREGAGLAEQAVSKSRLAIVPGYSQHNFITSLEAPQIIRKFLDDPLTDLPAGAAAASQVAPAPEKTQ